MFVGLFKSIACLLFFFLIWFAPGFRSRVITLFDFINQKLAQRQRFFIAASLALYVIITLILLHHHAITGDEVQAWLLSRDTKSLKEMYGFMGYEGTPALWHTILRPFSRNGFSYSTIYAINYAFIVVAVAIWLIFAPFPLFIRIILPFSMVIMTEYSVNARSYALSTMLLFLSLALYSYQRSKWFWWSFAFFLLANTNIHSTILCCGFAIYLLYDWIKTRSANCLKSLLIIGAGILVAVWQVLPPNDIEPSLAEMFYQGPLSKILISVVSGNLELSPLLYFALLIQVLLALKSRGSVLGLAATQLAFFYLFEFRHMGELRHHYFLFLSLLLFLWLGTKETSKQVTGIFLGAIIILTVSSSMPVARKILREDPKVGDRMTAFMKDSLRLDTSTFIASQPDYIPLLVLPYIRDYKFYLPNVNRFATFLVWNDKREQNLFNGKATRNVADLALKFKGYQQYYYLTNLEIPEDSMKTYNIRLVKMFADKNLNADIQTEKSLYYLYQLKQASN